MIRTHCLKILDEFADSIYSGDKTFEIRENDRGFQKGDRVFFETIDKSGCKVTHPIKNVPYTITYVLSGWGLKDNYVAFGVKLGEEESSND